MPIQSKYIFVVKMDVEPEKEDFFNEIYDKEHVPMLSDAPGVISIARFKTHELEMIIGGERRKMVVENEPKYTALYEIESPDVLLSDEWGKVVDAGRWSGEVRPFTKNRRHTLHELILP